MNREFERGKRDAEHGIYRPPHDKSIIDEVTRGYTKEEIEDRQDYSSGREAGLNQKK